MESIPILIILFAGFKHAFEADHLLAVSTIVSQRKSTLPAVKDGLFWGLGHSTTILLIGSFLIILKIAVTGQEHTFHYFEACVGLMLVLVAVYRLNKFFGVKEVTGHHHHHEHQDENITPHIHLPLSVSQKNLHKVSYGIGLVHGLAGSGELVAAAMLTYKAPLSIVMFLLLFTVSCMAGMFIAAGLFSIPFSKRIMASDILQSVLTLLSSGLCLAHGFYSIYKNLFT